MTLYTRLSNALDSDMNIKLVLMATGLDLGAFWRTFEEQMFTNAQIESLSKVLKEWEI